MNGKYVPSLLAAIGGVIERHLEEFAPGQLDLPIALPPDAQEPIFGIGGPICPKCGSVDMIREEGCIKCLSCGYSKCS